MASTHSVEALAEEIGRLLSVFDKWSAEIDSDIAGATTRYNQGCYTTPRAATLLHLLSDVKERTMTFEVLEEVLDELALLRTDIASSSLPGLSTCVLDALHGALTFTARLDASSSLAHDLARCFLAAASPVWADVQRWVARGMEVALSSSDTESRAQGQASHPSANTIEQIFFQRNADVEPLDAEFWSCGYTLASHTLEKEGESLVPFFLKPLADDILTAGKSVGLLRALGIDDLLPTNLASPKTLQEVILPSQARPHPFTDSRNHSLFHRKSNLQTSHNSAADIVRAALFQNQLPSLHATRPDAAHVQTSSPMLSSPSSSSPPSPDFPLSWPDSPGDALQDGEQLSRALLEPALSEALSATLSPIFAIVRKRLHEALTAPFWEGGCDLMAHLQALQGLYLMRQGASMGQWCEAVFSRVRQACDSASVFLVIPFRSIY